MSYTAGTFSAKPSDIERKWFVVDGTGLVVGRVAAEIAKILRGKHKPIFTAHIDCGDHVVVVNADKMVFTGNKMEKRKFYWHTGYPGGVKERTMGQLLNGKFPDRVLKNAVRRMMPKESPLARAQLKHLHVYATSDHPHLAQNPEVLDLASRNSKNIRG